MPLRWPRRKRTSTRTLEAPYPRSMPIALRGSSAARPTWKAPLPMSMIEARFRPRSPPTSALSSLPRRWSRRNRCRACAGLTVEARTTVGDDRLGITGVFCAIAETGTLVFVSAADTPTATTLLPDTHIAVVSAHRIVDTMEDAFALIRTERGRLPRAINLISGPSRTGDIEQTIVLGAHGPFRVHILVLAAAGEPLARA